MSYKLLYCAILLSGIISISQYHWVQRENRFKNYLKEFNKSYSSSEFMIRMRYFEESLKEIEKLNSKKHGTGAKHGLTKFSDLSPDEKYMNRRFCGYGSTCSRREQTCYRIKAVQRFTEGLPVRWDWRKHDGVISPVKEQKKCNGCWAFSIVENLESMAAIAGLGRQQLSVQELLDCSETAGNCDSGNVGSALNRMCTLKYNITTEDNYPLKLVTQKCKMEPKYGRGLKGYAIHCDVTDEYLKRLLTLGPVIAIIDPEMWPNYVDGIVTRNCPKKPLRLFHAVQIVGYDVYTNDEDDVDDVPYYIVRNSWGSDWGEDGYIRIAMGDSNLCGIRNHLATLEAMPF